jgi:hypothetical protein
MSVPIERPRGGAVRHRRPGRGVGGQPRPWHSVPVAAGAGSRAGPTRGVPARVGWPGGILVVVKPPRAAGRRYLPNSPFNNMPVQVRPVEQFALDDQVTHDKYGLGRVIGVEDEIAVLVDFGTRQERITVPDAKLTKL